MAQKLHDQYGFSYDNLKVLKGGWFGWQDAGYPIATAAPPPSGSPTVPPLPTVTAIPTPSATPLGGAPLTAADQALIGEVVMTTLSLRSYHFTLTSPGAGSVAALDVAGDFVAPDSLYYKEAGGVELLRIGSQVFRKDPAGAWLLDPNASAGPAGGGAGNNVAALVLNGLGQFDTFSPPQFRILGVETVHGVSIRHFAGAEPGTGVMSPAILHLWIDPLTGYLHKFRLESNGEAVDLEVTRHNDPSIVLPVPPTPAPATTPVPLTPLPVVTISPQPGMPRTGAAAGAPWLLVGLLGLLLLLAGGLGRLRRFE